MNTDKRFRRLRNATLDILAELDDLEKEVNSPAPGAPGKAKRLNRFERQQQENEKVGSWRKPAELKKAKRKTRTP